MQPSPAPLLVIRRQDASITQYEWNKPTLTIGRDGANDIIVDHPLASRRHARLEDDEVYDYNAIDALVYRLRQRIEQDPGNPRFLVTVRGFGYKLITQPD